jgi:hypothetical protein
MSNMMTDGIINAISGGQPISRKWPIVHDQVDVQLQYSLHRNQRGLGPGDKGKDIEKFTLAQPNPWLSSHQEITS